MSVATIGLCKCLSPPHHLFLTSRDSLVNSRSQNIHFHCIKGQIMYAFDKGISILVSSHLILVLVNAQTAIISLSTKMSEYRFQFGSVIQVDSSLPSPKPFSNVIVLFFASQFAISFIVHLHKLERKDIILKTEYILSFKLDVITPIYLSQGDYTTSIFYFNPYFYFLRPKRPSPIGTVSSNESLQLS